MSKKEKKRRGNKGESVVRKLQREKKENRVSYPSSLAVSIDWSVVSKDYLQGNAVLNREYVAQAMGSSIFVDN